MRPISGTVCIIRVKSKQLKMKENRIRPVWQPPCLTGERVETHRTPDSVLDFERKEVNNMAKLPKLIKALLNFSDALPEQLLNQGYAVLKGLTGNANFTTLPIDLALLKTTLDAYSAAIADARDGSKKAIALRDRLGGDVIRMLKGLALYVELNCKEDMNTFLSSGFQPRSSTRTPAQPLDQPVVLYIDQGNSGELLALIKGVRGARTYDVRWGPVGAGGATPASWSMKTAAKTKPSISIDGLTPGTTYAIQVRAYGPLGHTEWSDSATRMCI